jgi:hypothetical protein
MRMLRSRGIWLQTLDGRSADLFHTAVTEAMNAAFPAPVRVQVRLGGGTIDQYSWMDGFEGVSGSAWSPPGGAR